MMENIDLIFLHKYLKINPVDILIRFINIEPKQIIDCVKFCKIYNYKFFLSDEELSEDAKDFYNLNITVIEQCKDKLLKQGLLPGFENPDTFAAYLDELDFKNSWSPLEKVLGCCRINYLKRLSWSHKFKCKYWRYKTLCLIHFLKDRIVNDMTD